MSGLSQVRLRRSFGDGASCIKQGLATYLGSYKVHLTTRNLQKGRDKVQALRLLPRLRSLQCDRASLRLAMMTP
jgi:hypothetical protein